VNKHSLIAATLFTGIFVASFFIEGNGLLFINGSALLVVGCGTLGAIFLCYPVEDIRSALRVTLNLHRNPPPGSEEVINALLETALYTRGKGIFAFEDMSEQSSVGFLKRALGLLLDGINGEELAGILHAEMFQFKQRRVQFERMFRQAALFAPAFGVAGSVIGLINMLAGITDPDVFLKTIPVALISPLYGIVLANSVCFPIAESIHSKTQKELLIQMLITDGVHMIQGEQSPKRLAIKLESLLTPSARSHENRSLKEIREILHDRRAQAEAAQAYG
jgi:chemotaxis protein MotA